MRSRTTVFSDESLPVLCCGADGSTGSSFLTETLAGSSGATEVIDLRKDIVPLNISEARFDEPKHQKPKSLETGLVWEMWGTLTWVVMGEWGPAV